MRLDQGEEHLVWVGRTIDLVGLSAWFWLPWVFAGYWLGHRKFSLRVAIGFAVVEAAAIGFALRWVLWHPVLGV